MKNRLIIILVLALALALPVFAQEEAAPIKLAEIELFNQGLLVRAVKEEQPSFKDEGHYLVRGEGYELLLGSEDVSQDSLVLGAAIHWIGEHAQEQAQEEKLTGPRDIVPGISLETLLGRFRNDNQYLAGRQDSAVLYIDGELPSAVSVGFIARDGQTVQLVEHDVYYQAGEGVMREGIQFTIESGDVTAIRSFADLTALSQQAAAEELQVLRDLQEENAYIAYGDMVGSQLAREDMELGGLDYFDTDYTAAVAHLGEPANEERHEDSDGSTLISCQWPGLEAVFRQKDGQSRAERITAVGDSLFEGPRGLRLGDTLAQALSSFEHSGTLEEDGGALYGDAKNQVAPYGMMRINPDNVMLYYAIQTETGKAGLVMEFVEDTLVSMSLTAL
ncbi:MAG: hypothetical protein GXZ04_06720 [Clostridiales bacterium]|nr:hypothetical protein [Clostridiales bacterium]